MIWSLMSHNETRRGEVNKTIIFNNFSVILFAFVHPKILKQNKHIFAVNRKKGLVSIRTFI